MVFSPPLFIFFCATTSSWENQCQNIAFQTFLSRLCGWEVTFAEYIPPFFPTMQRLRCQAKVEAKTLKLHTPGCMDVHNIKCVVDNTINMWLCSQETFFFNTNVLIPEMICIISLMAATQQTSSHPCLLDTLSSMEAFFCFHTSFSGAFPFLTLK